MHVVCSRKLHLLERKNRKNMAFFYDDDYNYMQHLKEVNEINEVDPVASFSVQETALAGKVLKSCVIALNNCNF